MKTQVSLLIKNESLFSRFMSFLWFINIFKKMPIDVTIDTEDNVQRMKPAKEPYLIDFEPGFHEMAFTDPRAKSKARYKALTGAFIGAAFNAGAGGSFVGGAIDGYNGTLDTTVRDGYISFNLNEGDVLKLRVRAKNNGAVKVKVLKK